MKESLLSYNFEHSIYKDEHISEKFKEIFQALKPYVVLTETFKMFEEELREKGVVQKAGYPLWFFAETEENVYLWKKGVSIEEKERYEFWINLKTLLKKRQEQLSRDKDFNFPFFNFQASFEGGGRKDTDIVEEEKRYLLSLEKILHNSFIHLQFISALKSVLTNREGAKERVILLELG